jgi:hypothetical protein
MAADTMTPLELLTARDLYGINGFESSDWQVIDTNADGTLLSMLMEYGVWQCNGSGAEFTQAVDPTAYTEPDGATGLRANELAMSDTGTRIIFVMNRWRSAAGADFDQDDVMAWDATAGTVRMTADSSPEYGKTNVWITPDGSRVLYKATGLGWCIADYGAATRTVVPVPIATYSGTAVGTSDISVIFHAKTQVSTAGGELITTIDGAVQDLFAATDLDADDAPMMSTDGAYIAFIHDRDDDDNLYVGYINDEDPPIDAPRVTGIEFSPGAIGRTSGAEVTVTVTIADATATQYYEIDADVLNGGAPFNEKPAQRHESFRDDGQSPDQTAGDGIFTGTIRATSAMDTFTGSEITVRIGVEEDQDGTANTYPERYCVADTIVAVAP